MSFATVYIISSFLLTTALSQHIISPTSNTTTSETYAVTANYYNFNNGLIICQKRDCIVSCGGTDRCQYLTIDASISDTLSLTCTEHFACYGLVISKGAKQSTNILCSKEKTCVRSIFMVSNSPQVTLTCTDPDVLSSSYKPCSVVTLNATNSDTVTVQCGAYGSSSIVLHGEHITSGLDVTCSGKSACVSADIYCPFNSPCTITSTADESAQDMNIFIEDTHTDFTWDCGTSATSCWRSQIYCGSDTSAFTSRVNKTTLGEWGCIDAACCPFGSPDIMCSANTPCQIDCDTENCNGHKINASLATSLQLDCGMNGCRGAVIECPKMAGAFCDISCVGNSSCEHAVILTSDTKLTEFEVSCSAMASCEYMHISLESDVVDLTLNCNAYYSCKHLNFISKETSVIDNLYMFCTGTYACYSLDISGSVDSHAEIKCIYPNACGWIDVNLKATSSTTDINVTCMDPTGKTHLRGAYSACYGSDWIISGYNSIVKTNKISFNCAAEGCVSPTINITDFQQIDIYCNGPLSCFGSTRGTAIYVKESDKLNIHCDGVSSCADVTIHCPSDLFGACSINCDASYHSCINMAIVAPLNLNISCPTNSSLNTCEQLDINCADSIPKPSWNIIENQWNCSSIISESYCCPITSTTTTTTSTTVITSTASSSRASSQSEIYGSIYEILSTALYVDIRNKQKSKSSNVAVYSVVSGSIIFLLCVAAILYIFYCKNKNKASESISLIKPVSTPNNPNSSNCNGIQSKAADAVLTQVTAPCVASKTMTNAKDDILPSEWVKLYSNGKAYYQNNKTKQTQWEKPTQTELAPVISTSVISTMQHSAPSLPNVLHHQEMNETVGAGLNSGGFNTNDTVAVEIAVPSSVPLATGIVAMGEREGVDYNIDERDQKIKYQEVKDFFDDMNLPNEHKAKYYTLFVSNGFDQLDVVKTISNKHLLDIGVSKLGHRKMILKKLQYL